VESNCFSCTRFGNLKIALITNNCVSLAKPVKLTEPPASNTLRNNLVIGFSALGFLLILISFFIVRYIRNQQSLIDTLRDEEIKLFREGNPDLVTENQDGNKAAQNLPYDEDYEIDLLQLNIGTNIKEQQTRAHLLLVNFQTTRTVLGQENLELYTKVLWMKILNKWP